MTACTDEELASSCLDLGSAMCASSSNVRTYEPNTCIVRAAAAGIAAAIVIPMPYGLAAMAVAEKLVLDNDQVCYQRQTDFEKYNAEYADVARCKFKYGIKCHVYVYQSRWDDNRPPCTAASRTCVYDKGWERTYAEERGLLTTGFCPECTGTGCAFKNQEVEQDVPGGAGGEPDACADVGRVGGRRAVRAGGLRGE